jgi:diguanylate cyclase (GGDEF)-like protein
VNAAMQIRSKSKRTASPKRREPASRQGDVTTEAGSGAAKPARGELSREQLEYYLGHLAQYDVLTELPNRSQFHDRLSGALARAARHKQMAGIMLLNVDAFKAINIKHGHRGGDLVLKEVAARLKQCTRQSDTVARMGGDEFAVILEDLTGKEGAEVPAQRALDALSRPMLIDGKEVLITATIGIALYPLDVADLDGLLRTADAAMCDAKDHERNTYRFYSAELDFKTQRDELRRAEIEKKLARLTPREREVLDILIAGKANKMIAYLLGASTRTIENHRASIMDKMQADSLPELVRMVLDHRGLSTVNAGPPAPG